tara:strand:+ start:569 stop:745 length:177 start_codon:yes stop_codon:yes gene_type:complete
MESFQAVFKSLDTGYFCYYQVELLAKFNQVRTHQGTAKYSRNLEVLKLRLLFADLTHL